MYIYVLTDLRCLSRVTFHARLNIYIRIYVYDTHLYIKIDIYIYLRIIYIYIYMYAHIGKRNRETILVTWTVCARIRWHTRERGNARTHALCPVYIVRNNEEFAQTGIPTFFKQGEQEQTALYGRMDKHTQPRITHRASRLGDMRIACLCTRAKPVSRVAYIHARTRSRNAHERSLFTAPTTETIDHHPRSTSTISDMVANICRAKHTNTIQYCLPTASGAQPFWSMLRYRQVPFVIAALSVSRSPVRILTLPWTCVMLHHADGTSVSNGKRAFHCESIEPLHRIGWYDWFVTFRCRMILILKDKDYIQYWFFYVFYLILKIGQSLKYD